MATCVWCGLLLSSPPLFPPVPANVWHHHHCRRGGSSCCANVMWCCLMWWCTCKSAHLEYFFLLKLFQPALNPSHDVGWSQCFLTSMCISTHATTNTNGKQPPSPLFPTPTPGMKAGGWRRRWMNRGAWEASASQASGKFLFFILFFCSTNNFFYN